MPPRDAAFVLQALLGTGFIGEADAWRQWLLRAAAGDPAELQIMYGLDGRHWLPELDLDWLPGYEGSSPVRIGNAATRQFQLDVWGETLDALHLAREADLETDGSAWDLQRALLAYLEDHWAELGNTPQAYSHVGLVNAARHLSGAHEASEPRAVRPEDPSHEEE